MIGLCRNICKIELSSKDITRAIRLGKAQQNKERRRRRKKKQRSEKYF